MFPTSSELRQLGAADLKGRWGEAALLTFVYFIIAIALGNIPLVGIILSLILIPMGWSYAIIFLSNHRHESDDPFNMSHLFDGYKDFGRIFLTSLLQGIYIFLWTLLLIVPGIIKSLSYALTPYILRDRKDLRNNGAIELSMAMMDGHKADLFWLYLSFFGWMLLCILSLGIGFFWLEPYMNSTMANFYEKVKAEFETGGVVIEEEVVVEEETTYNKSER